MNKFVLSKEEQEILDAVEAGEFASVLTASRKEVLEAMAKNTLKDRNANKKVPKNLDNLAINSKQED